MWTSETVGKEKVNLRTPRTPPPHLFFSTLSGHMPKESSANVEQFMRPQMRVHSSFTPGDSWSYLSCVQKTVFLSPPSAVCSSTLLHPLLFVSSPSDCPLFVLVLSPPSSTLHSQFRFPSVFSFPSALLGFTCSVYLSINCFHSFYHLSFLLSISLSLTPALCFHFCPSPLSSLYPYNGGYQWIIQKPCRMIMGN